MQKDEKNIDTQIMGIISEMAKEENIIWDAEDGFSYCAYCGTDKYVQATIGEDQLKHEDACLYVRACEIMKQINK